MKKPIGVAALAALAVALLASGAMAQTLSPSGTYEVKLAGFDNGLAIVTLGADGSISGYGVTAKSGGVFGGVFDIQGTWVSGKKNSISGTLETDIPGGIPELPYTGKMGKGTFSIKWGTSGERDTLTGRLTTSVPDVSGEWLVVVKYRYGRSEDLEQFSTNETHYATFDFPYNPTRDEKGSLIINSRGKIYASVLFNGILLTGWGQSNAGATKLRIAGKDAGGESFSITATRP